MKSSKLLIITLLSFILVGTVNAADESFPGRKKYPDVKLYTLDKLKINLSNVIVIDARSKT